jgi:hypothetical protein
MTEVVEVKAASQRLNGFACEQLHGKFFQNNSIFLLAHDISLQILDGIIA